MHLICGVDPGLSGAIAFLDPAAGSVTVFDMPTHEIKGKRKVDLYQLGRVIDMHSASIAMAVVEDVHAMPKQGVSSSFNFGFAAGAAQAALAANFAPMTIVSPQRWKAAFGLGSDKDASRQMASRIMPKFCHLWARAKDDGRAEAVLIAIYGSRLPRSAAA